MCCVHTKLLTFEIVTNIENTFQGFLRPSILIAHSQSFKMHTNPANYHTLGFKQFKSAF